MRLAQAIAYELQNNLAFNTYYEVRAENTQIIIEAREFGSQFNLTYTLPLNTTLVSNVGGSSLYSYNGVLDYTSFGEFYVGTGEYGDTIDRLEFYQVGAVDVPFTDEFLQYNTNGAVKNYVDVVYPLKKNNTTFSLTNLDQTAYDNDKEPILRPYFVLFGDSYRYTNNGEKKRIVQGCSSVRWVQNAAMHKLDGYKLSDYVWNNGSTQRFSFLTDRPDYTPVTYDSHQFLQFIAKKGHGKGTYWLELVVRFYDGTTQTQLFGGTSGLSYTDLWGNQSFDCSPTVLGIQNIESAAGQLVESYEVSIIWTTTPTSAISRSYPKSYRMLRRCNDQSLNLCWFNKFGGWDSLEFNGLNGKGLTRSISEVTRALPFDANVRVGSTINSLATDDEITLTYNIESNTETSADSGLIDSSHYEWIRGLLDSACVLTYDRQQRQFRAIIVTNYDYLWNSDNTEFNLRVTFKYTVDNNTISR
jgi:hypothetical protein